MIDELFFSFFIYIMSAPFVVAIKKKTDRSETAWGAVFKMLSDFSEVIVFY